MRLLMEIFITLSLTKVNASANSCHRKGFNEVHSGDCGTCSFERS